MRQTDFSEANFRLLVYVERGGLLEVTILLDTKIDRLKVKDIRVFALVKLIGG